jgi:hypothetical protein
MISDPTSLKIFYENLEKLGEEEVRKLIARGAFAGKKRFHAQNWLTQKDRDKQADAQEHQAVQEDEANKHTEKANRIAWITAAVAAVAAATAAVALVWGR